MSSSLTKSPPAVHIDDAAGAGDAHWLGELTDGFGREDLLFFRSAWRTVFESYRLKYRLWAARQNDRLVGVLPLVEQHSPLTGHQLVSLPWFDATGILAHDEAVQSQLLNHALEQLKSTRACVVQIRELRPLDLSPHVRTDKVLMRLRLCGEPEALWKGLNPKVRNQVRKAEKGGLIVEFGKGGLLAEFFNIYSRNMRDLGSPSHSQEFFASILEAFPQEASIAVARVQNQAVGAGFTLANGRFLEIPWASSLREFNHLCVNHGLYWKILERACTDRFEWFHFGRSTLESGTYHFKRQWGAEAVPLYWYFLSDNLQAARRCSIPPQQGHGLSAKIWQRLPLFVTRRLGPRLIAQIP